MKSIKVAGKKLKLASRLTRLYALFIDIAILGAVQSAFVLILWIIIGISLWPQNGFPDNLSVPPDGSNQLMLGVGLGVFAFLASIGLWTFGLFFLDGFRKGQGIGKKLLSLQVVRLSDGKPCTFKDAFLRRFAGLFQPFDFLWSLGKKRQRLGDKFAETVVVRYEPVAEGTEDEKEAPEAVLEKIIDEMKNRLSEAREKVDASVAVENEFREVYEDAVAQAERWEERALIALKAGHEEMAREDMEKRKEYQRLAASSKKQWEEQQQVVRDLSDLLEHLQQKTMAAEQQKAVVVAQQKNVDAEAHLREMLEAVETGQAFDRFAEMHQAAMEAATLARSAAETDVSYQETQLEREFAGYAEDASIEKDLAELKSRLR